MGLSVENPKETVATIQLLGKLAQGLDDFKKYGLDKLVKDAYGLSEKEQADADKARASIAENKKLIEKHEVQLDDLEAISSEISTKQTKLDADKLELEKREAALESKIKAQTAYANDLAKRETTLGQDKAKFAQEREAHTANVQALNEEKKRLTQYEASLKEKAKALKGLAQEL